MSKRDNEQMGRDAVYFGIIVVFAIIGHAYSAFKAPTIYWRISKYFWYFFGGCAIFGILNFLLNKLNWFYGIQNFLSAAGAWLMLPGFIWFCMIPYFVLRAKTHADWESWPTFTDHCRAREIDTTAITNINCYSCGAHSIKNIGFTNSSDNRRLHICNQCSATLYRSLQG
jgi:hypothetical protein